MDRLRDLDGCPFNGEALFGENIPLPEIDSSDFLFEQREEGSTSTRLHALPHRRPPLSQCKTRPCRPTIYAGARSGCSRAIQSAIRRQQVSANVSASSTMD